MADYKIEAKNSRSEKLKAMNVPQPNERYDLTSPDGLKAAQSRMQSMGLPIQLGQQQGDQQ